MSSDISESVNDRESRNESNGQFFFKEEKDKILEKTYEQLKIHIKREQTLSNQLNKLKANSKLELTSLLYSIQEIFKLIKLNRIEKKEKLKRLSEDLIVKQDYVSVLSEKLG